MKFAYVSLFLAATAAAAEISLKDIPTCAAKCGLGTPPDHCGKLDAKCACEDPVYVADTACCISKECGEDDAKKAVEFTEKLCSGVGVKDLPKTATCAASASSTGSSSSSTASSDSSASSSSSSSSSASATETGGAALVYNKDASIIAAVGAAAFAFLA
ncbi:CFEM domain-containing protein [Aspergillus ruber CBS 135680]|uniref:CFEM domain-containing protein n=1 Tax=Aspergillus ruber (strain CBS 135680) TaxID=1388766 RepID=A0A017SRA9_ASPRC|nr:uncharacterized protein EURHEDRAFT_373434 [Aspergillus ruber CBS 135680]EYE99497.1 hypothetical protein EURHEDRAFT_373434 [Aspergillus ruber CBS 135680]